MGRRVFYLLIFAILPLCIAEFWRYRLHSAATTAAQFAPRTIPHARIPAGTPIPAILKDGLSESTERGASALAFVAADVVIRGRVAIPGGTRLNGVVEEITKNDDDAVVRYRFTSIVINENENNIETQPVIVSSSVASEFDILVSALDAVGEAGIGTALGAATQTEDAIVAGLSAGALRGASALDDRNIQIRLVLSESLGL
jgi:hypothetical protein